MFVCICNTVTDHQIREAVNEGACSLSDLSATLQVATRCKRCADCAQKILDQACLERVAIHSPAAAYTTIH